MIHSGYKSEKEVLSSLKGIPNTTKVKKIHFASLLVLLKLPPIIPPIGREYLNIAIEIYLKNDERVNKFSIGYAGYSLFMGF